LIINGSIQKYKLKEIEKMKIKKQFILTILVFLLVSWFGFSEVIEKIYAVVNGELITLSELKNAEIEMTRVIARQFKGEELTKEVEKMKKNLLDRLIDHKVLLSHAKDKNYEVDGDVEMLIKGVMKENDIKTDKELRSAIASQGMDYNEWKKQLKENRIQQMFIHEQIGSKINIDNSAIMEYFKRNVKDYTKPLKLSLNCIFLNKENYIDPNALEEKKKTIDAELKGAFFEEIAKKYSELPNPENKVYLGEFKKGELDAKIEEASLKLTKGRHTGWIETENGWYITQLMKIIPAALIEYKEVRDEILNKLRNEEQNKRLQEYIKELKKQSHIKIYQQEKSK